MRAMQIAALVLVPITWLAGCSREAPPPPPETATQAPPVKPAWTNFTEGFIASRFKVDPMFGVQSGRHEFDGQMPDWSRSAIEADVIRLRAQLAELRKFDAAGLTPEQRLERQYLEWVIENEIFWRADAGFPFRNPAWYLERLDPSMYLTREYAPLPTRLRGFLGYARAIPKLTADIRANLRTPLPRPFIERAVAGFGGYASFFRNEMPAAFANLEDAELKGQLEESLAAAASAMEQLTAWIEAQRAHAKDDFALGPQKFAQMLRVTEKLEVPLEDLELVGRKDLERNVSALTEACALFAPDAALAACVDKMRANKPAGGAVEGARQQLDELRQFVLDKKLVSIPSQQQALVAESPPYRRGNFAYISIPGPWENPAVKVTYYVAPPDEKWSVAERNAYVPGRAYLLYVSVHEVWPGHYLHSQFSNRNPSSVAALWWNYSFGEGWAHYTEEMMYDAGLGHDQPEMRVGMLVNALMRNVRYLSAICLHTGCMTLEESEKMFREQGLLDAGNARQQALRGTYDPGYLAYTLGKLMIRKLRADWLAVNRGATVQQFHDRFLSFGSPPVPLVREQMLGTRAGAL